MTFIRAEVFSHGVHSTFTQVKDLNTSTTDHVQL